MDAAAWSWLAIPECKAYIHVGYTHLKERNYLDECHVKRVGFISFCLQSDSDKNSDFYTVEDGGTTSLRNVVNRLPIIAALYPTSTKPLAYIFYILI